MTGRAAGIAVFAAWAQVASGFLIPGDLPPNPQFESLSLVGAPLKHQLVTVPCSDCVFSSAPERIDESDVNSEPIFLIQGGANSVAINLTISEDGRQLEINGESVYPLGLGIEDIFRSPKSFIQQVSSSASIKEIENGEAATTDVEVTGHGVSVVEEAAVSDTGDVLVPIRYMIFELNQQPVTIDDVSVHLLKQPSGELSIMHVETTSRGPPRMEEVASTPLDLFESVPPPPPFTDHHHHHSGGHKMESHKECKTLPASLCKLKHMIEAKVHGLRKGGCRGKMGMFGRPHDKLPGHIKPHFLRPGHDEAHHHGRPHHMRPHSEHHGGGHHHRHHGHHASHFAHAFSRGLAAVMIPTMAGIAVGMAVSLLGLMFGRLIGFLWFTVYRGGRRGQASVRLDEGGDESEKQLLAKAVDEGGDADEALPVYEEAPAYPEAVKGEQ